MPPKSRFIAAFDTEDDGKGNPYLFGIVHGKGAYSCETREKFLDYISTLAKDLRLLDTVLELWATNLEYDLVNLFGPERIAECSLTFGKSYLVGASWKGHNVDFKDTVRHIPLSVKELGTLVGLEKIEAHDKQSRDAKYMLRDAAITRRTAVWLDELYKGFGIKPKLTLASSALTIWREKYWQREVALPADEIVSNAKCAYYGGRTEAFAIGTFTNVRAIDVASMFPWAMINAPFPIPWGDFSRQVDTIAENGIYQARIGADINYPSLPVRTLNGTQYPNGSWIGWYTGHELLHAKASAYQVTILQGYTFTMSAIPFKGYVEAFFKLKNAEKGPARIGYKLLLNSLYGKFGQTGERVICTTVDAFMQLESPPTDYRIWNGLCLYKKDGRPPPWGNNVWPALITARARVRLAQEMERIRKAGGRVLYCDTDSVLFTGAEALEYPLKAKAPGQFELRGTYPKALIQGKKEYALWDENGECEIHVKGVPKAARMDYLINGRAEFERPTRFREAARRGERANVWQAKHKQRKVSYKNRTVRADGTLEPINLSELENKPAKKAECNGKGKRKG